MNFNRTRNKSQNDSSMIADENGPAYAALMWLKRFAWMAIYNDVVEQSSLNGTNIAGTCLDLLRTQRSEINNSVVEGQSTVPMPEEILIESSRILHADAQSCLIVILKQIEAPTEAQINQLTIKITETIDLQGVFLECRFLGRFWSFLGRFW